MRSKKVGREINTQHSARIILKNVLRFEMLISVSYHSSNVSPLIHKTQALNLGPAQN